MPEGGREVGRAYLEQVLKSGGSDCLPDEITIMI